MRDINKYTADYLTKSFEDYQVYYRRKKILEVMGRFSHRRILEIGCGMEPLFGSLDLEEYDKYYVVEPSTYFFDNAKKKCEGNDKIVLINDYFKYQDELANQQFDFIVCSSLLHEVENPEGILNDIHRVACSNTIIHINVPNASSFHRLLAKESGLIDSTKELSTRNRTWQQNRVFDLDDISQLLLKNGFKIIEKGSYFLKPFTHDQMYEMLQQGLLDEKVLDGLYEMTKLFPEYGSEIFVNSVRNN